MLAEICSARDIEFYLCAPNLPGNNITPATARRARRQCPANLGRCRLLRPWNASRHANLRRCRESKFSRGHTERAREHAQVQLVGARGAPKHS